MTGKIMKKLHSSFVAIFFALFAMVSFTACSSDDDGPSSEEIKENIVGMWQVTHISGWDYDDTEEENLIKVDKDIPEESSSRVMFKGDGTYRFYWYYDNGWQPESSTYTYEVSGNKIFFYDYDGDIEDTYTVISIKNNTAVLEVTLEEGPQYKQRITCKRVD